MLTSAVTVLERRNEFTGAGATVPYEAGWASEAVFFVQASSGRPRIEVVPEVSPDGIVWLPWGPAVALEPDDEVAAVGLVNFGSWIRLRFTGPTAEAPVSLLIHLALKG